MPPLQQPPQLDVHGWPPSVPLPLLALLLPLLLFAAPLLALLLLALLLTPPPLPCPPCPDDALVVPPVPPTPRANEKSLPVAQAGGREASAKRMAARESSDLRMGPHPPTRPNPCRARRCRQARDFRRGFSQILALARERAQSSSSTAS
jgi:hypothetical protein